MVKKTKQKQTCYQDEKKVVMFIWKISKSIGQNNKKLKVNVDMLEKHILIKAWLP